MKTVTILAVALALGLGVAAAVLGGAPATTGRAAAPPRWSFAPHMPHRRSYAASAEIGGKIYVAAGMVGNSGRPLNLFERFDARSNEWAALTPVPQAFSAAAGASLDERMYVVGGNSAEVNGRQVYSYDVRRGRWSREAPLPAPRTNLAAVALGGKLYALGGLDPVQPTRTVFVYDPRRRHWSQAAPLPKSLHALAAVVFHGEIWALGGRVRSGTILHRVWIYNARRNRWRAGPSMPTPMETLGAVATGNRIDAVLESVYLIYDGRTRRWRQGPSLNVPRHALALDEIRGTLYAMGGCVVPQLEDSSVVEKIPLGA